MVVEGNKLSFYPLAHSGDKITTSAVKVSATSQVPKGKTAALQLAEKDPAFTGDVDFGNANRSTIEVKTTYKGKTDTFKFQVEKP